MGVDLESILLLSNKNEVVRSIDVATHMQVTKQSVHRAIKNLKEQAYINVDTKGHITLTDKGKLVAEETYEKHEILSNFFISLGVPAPIAYEDACKIEHDISKETFNALKQFINKKDTM